MIIKGFIVGFRLYEEAMSDLHLKDAASGKTRHFELLADEIREIVRQYGIDKEVEIRAGEKEQEMKTSIMTA